MHSEHLTKLIADTEATFVKLYQSKSEFAAAAPGRANLIGEHIDYNDGIVLPMAIDRYTVVTARNNHSKSISIFSQAMNESVVIDLNLPIKLNDKPWANYAIGVLREFQQLGHRLKGFDAAIGSSVPVGAGLSSSASLEVSVAVLIQGILGTKLTPTEMAMLCHRTEHDFVGVPCGVMDQFATVFGKRDHLVKLDCRTNQVEHVPWPQGDANTSDVSILIIDTRVKHNLAESEYAQRQNKCRTALAKLKRDSFRDVSLDCLISKQETLDTIEFRRARHVVSEMLRCSRFIEFLATPDWNAAGQTLFESHASLRDDYEVSSVELDFLVDTAQKLGAAQGIFGVKMTGAGFGGCTIGLVQTNQADGIAKQLCKAYAAKFGIEPESFVCRPASGPVLLQSSMHSTAIPTAHDDALRDQDND